MTAPKTPKIVRAQAVAEVMATSEKRAAIAARYGVPAKTLDSWREDLDADPEFAFLVRAAVRRILEGWRPQVHRLVRTMAAELERRLLEDPTAFTPEEMLGAIRFLGDLATQADGMARTIEAVEPDAFEVEADEHRRAH